MPAFQASKKLIHIPVKQKCNGDHKFKSVLVTLDLKTYGFTNILSEPNLSQSIDNFNSLIGTGLFFLQ